MMARLNLPMTLTVLPLMPLFVIIQRRFSVLLKARADEARNEVGSATSVLNEHLGAVPQIQFLGAEHASARRVASVWDGMLRAQWIQRQSQIGDVDLELRQPISCCNPLVSCCSTVSRIVMWNQSSRCSLNG